MPDQSLTVTFTGMKRSSKLIKTPAKRRKISTKPTIGTLIKADSGATTQRRSNRVEIKRTVVDLAAYSIANIWQFTAIPCPDVGDRSFNRDGRAINTRQINYSIGLRSADTTYQNARIVFFAWKDPRTNPSYSTVFSHDNSQALYASLNEGTFKVLSDKCYDINQNGSGALGQGRTIFGTIPNYGLQTFYDTTNGASDVKYYMAICGSTDEGMTILQYLQQSFTDC
uniref:Coat protein n=1 Tax=uncultured prokaryote TaxID=198431 RepID=A0A0H5Q630_9ZZZZ|nr:hypothetical protein [uncultured prokaryote]